MGGRSGSSPVPDQANGRQQSQAEPVSSLIGYTRHSPAQGQGWAPFTGDGGGQPTSPLEDSQSPKECVRMPDEITSVPTSAPVESAPAAPSMPSVPLQGAALTSAVQQWVTNQGAPSTTETTPAQPVEVAPVAPVAPEPVAPPPPTLFEFGGRKVAPGDEQSLAALQSDWQRQQATLTRLQQERIALQEQMKALSAARAQAQVAPVEQKPTLPPEQAEALKAKFFEDPLGALAEMQQYLPQAGPSPEMAALQQQVQMMQAERQAYAQIDEARAQFPDFDQHTNRIVELVSEVPGISLAKAYEWAKAEALAQAAQSVQPMPSDPAQLLQDPNFLAQLTNNPQVKQAILAAHVQEIRTGAPPQVLGAQLGAVAPAIPASAPKTTKEAGAQARAWLAQQR